MSDTVYIKMDRSVEVTHEKVTIGDIAKIESKNKNIVNNIKSIKILADKPELGNRYVISIMKIIEIIDEKFQNVDISNIGETDCIVEFKKSNTSCKPLEILKTGIICILLFFGAGFSIMSFNNDVSIDQMFLQISGQISEDTVGGAKILELTYAIGLAVGITVFYNHFGPKKITKDPTPIETEMRKYENEINDALVDGHNREDGKLDLK
ncbi:MAG: stage V sporulation protein AA [Eubacterium sp.]|uniref:stage V sporulation protein AA n=1 Tax=Eubacterium sp. TaxID=142586 RepID=UPI00300F5864